MSSKTRDEQELERLWTAYKDSVRRSNVTRAEHTQALERWDAALDGLAAAHGAEQRRESWEVANEAKDEVDRLWSILESQHLATWNAARAWMAAVGVTPKAHSPSPAEVSRGIEFRIAALTRR